MITNTARFSDRLESFVYPSGLLTGKTLKGMNINKQIMTYTKHYYISTTLNTGIGAERISSVIGSGNSVGYNVCHSSFPSSNDLVEMNQKVAQAGQALQSDYDYFEKQLSLSQPFSTRPSCGTSYTGTETPYWFHPDHLGSSSYIINLSGEISQHSCPERSRRVEYLPFGETLVEEHKNSNNSPYKFNAKELDDETGNYYYGARYLNPKWSFWLSVDPLAEKYHGWSPYSYTLLNPVRLIDPDGRAPEDVIIRISNKQVGTTQIRLIGSENVSGSPRTIEVPVYLMTVTDDVTGMVSQYHVTRDGPVINSSNPVNETGFFWSLLGREDTYNVNNTAFEPESSTGKYVGVPLVYPTGTDLEAFGLRNSDGTDKLATNPARGTLWATEIMIHVGGEYTTNSGENRITGSLGCFGLAGKDSGNDGMSNFINDVVNRREINRKAGAGTNIIINIDQRQNVEWNKKVNSQGNSE